VDLRRFDTIDDKESMIDLLAMKLVHESTHGHLCSKRIIQDRCYARAERLCFKEEKRFARKLGVEMPADWGVIPDNIAPPPDRARLKFARAEMRTLGQRLQTDTPHDSSGLPGRLC
jgi:hypothetical protein